MPVTTEQANLGATFIQGFCLCPRQGLATSIRRDQQLHCSGTHNTQPWAFGDGRDMSKKERRAGGGEEGGMLQEGAQLGGERKEQDDLGWQKQSPAMPPPSPEGQKPPQSSPDISQALVFTVWRWPGYLNSS